MPEFDSQLCHLPEAGHQVNVSCLGSVNLDAVGIEMPPSPSGAGFKVKSGLWVITKVQENSWPGNVKY